MKPSQTNPEILMCYILVSFTNHYLEHGEAGQTRHEVDEVRLGPGHAERPLHEAGPRLVPHPVLNVVIKLGTPLRPTCVQTCSIN